MTAVERDYEAAVLAFLAADLVDLRATRATIDTTLAELHADPDGSKSRPLGRDWRA